MSKEPENIIGKRFGLLVIIEESEPYIFKSSTRRGYNCKCDCGKMTRVSSSNLKSGSVISCGCERRKLTTAKATKHGLSTHQIHTIHKNMLQRCYNPNRPDYKHYGGRGIEVCEEWKNSLEVFYQWATTNGYEPGLSIERNNVDGNYEPANCKWIPKADQVNNRRNTIRITLEGIEKTLSEWCIFYNVKHSRMLALYHRKNKQLAKKDLLK